MRLLLLNLVLILILLSGICSAEEKGRAFTYNSNDKRDPFSPLVTKDGKILAGARSSSSSEAAKVELEGIIWDPSGKSLAIINGKPVREQERILGLQVLKIKKDSIIMQKEGKVMVINLKKGGENEGEK